MRSIEILDSLRLQFPHREAEFDLGVEVGALAVLMAQGEPMIRRFLLPDCVEQLRPLAEGFRYVLVATPGPDGLFEICLSSPAYGRPRLRVVSRSAL